MKKNPEIVEILETTGKYISNKGVSQEEFDKIINKIGIHCEIIVSCNIRNLVHFNILH